MCRGSSFRVYPPERFLSHHAYRISALDLASIVRALPGMTSLNAWSAVSARRSRPPCTVRFAANLVRRDANDRSIYFALTCGRPRRSYLP
jgi:hypothetical protein